MLATADIFLFEEFRLDRRGEGLSRSNERGVFVPVTIGPRALDVLTVLVERPGQLVFKEEVMAAVWGRTVVENANLTVQISGLRRILDQGRAEGSCIQTVVARGYRFVTPVTRLKQETRPESATQALRPSIGENESAAVLVPHRGSQTTVLADLRPARARRYSVRRSRVALAGIAAVVTATVLAVAAWWIRPGPILTSAPVAATAPALRPAGAPHLSIVVLPFADLNEGRGQQYFADSITDDLTTDLSRLAGMFVIARNTAFTYKDKTIDAKQIGRELGVRYVLEGSVRRSGDQVRVNAQLVDAETGAHLWAERFDRDTSDPFAVQNEITGRIALTLHVELVGAEAARPMERPDAMDFVLRGARRILQIPDAGKLCRGCRLVRARVVV